MRFIHTSDWQIGMTRHFLDDDGQSRFTADREKAIRKIGTLAREGRADFVVVAGDVFDSNLLQPRTVRRALDALSDIPVPVYLLPGNHDALTPVSIYTSSEFTRFKPSHVTVLVDTAIHRVDSGTEVAGIPLRTNQVARDMVTDAIRAFPPRADDGVRVVVGHGQASTTAPGAVAAIDIDQVESLIQERCLDYLALGDRHSLTAVGNSGRIWYSGTPEPTDYDEVEAGYVLLVDLTTGSCKVESHPVGEWRFVQQRLNLVSAHAVRQVEDFFSTLSNKPQTIVKLELEGTITLMEKVQIDAAIEEARHTFGAIDRPLHHDDLVVQPSTGEIQQLGLTGFADSVFRQIQEDARSDGPDNMVARDALALLYRLAKGRN